MSSIHEAEIVINDDGLSVPVLDSNEARELTDKIRRALEFTWDLVTTAYKGKAWAALGYSTWDEYCTREFGTQHIAIPREERQEIVGSLREAGMSIRAIASATGAARNTVKSDLRQMGQFDPPAPEVKAPPRTDENPKIEGMDGKLYSRADPKPAVPGPKPAIVAGPSFDEDQAPEDGGIFPLDATEVLDRNAKTRVQNIQRLTGSNGKYSQAPLPMVIQLAGQIAYTSAGADDLDLEETTSLADNGSRAVLVLTQLLKTVDTTAIVDAVTIEKIRANLNDAQETIDEVLTILEEG